MSLIGAAIICAVAARNIFRTEVVSAQTRTPAKNLWELSLIQIRFFLKSKIHTFPKSKTFGEKESNSNPKTIRTQRTIDSVALCVYVLCPTKTTLINAHKQALEQLSWQLSQRAAARNRIAHCE